jgi:Fe2+ transport system protein FeoA
LSFIRPARLTAVTGDLPGIQAWFDSYSGSFMLAPATSSTLRDLAPGDIGRIIGFESGHRAYRRKLLAMGLTPGVEFEILRFAPLGDPVEIRVRGFDLSLRREEAHMIQIERK